jgi:multidrug efflux pump subunit AcrB
MSRSGKTARDDEGELPDVRVSFEPQDIVSRVMSFGSPTPIEVAVSGPSLPSSKEHAEKLLAKLNELPFLRDAQIAQTLDAPTVNVQIDRERAGLLGVNVQDVTRSLVAATTSSRFTVPVFWADPGTGISYNVQVQIPEERTQTLEDLGNTPVSSSSGKPCCCATWRRSSRAPPWALTSATTWCASSASPRTSTTSIRQRHQAVRKAIAEVGPAPDGKTKVDMRGQVVPYEPALRPASAAASSSPSS